MLGILKFFGHIERILDSSRLTKQTLAYTESFKNMKRIAEITEEFWHNRLSDTRQRNIQAQSTHVESESGGQEIGRLEQRGLKKGRKRTVRK